jgi:hypothetical protein
MSDKQLIGSFKLQLFTAGIYTVHQTLQEFGKKFFYVAKHDEHFAVGSLFSLAQEAIHKNLASHSSAGRGSA